VDIAGLVKGASQGEGLGNQFLGHIRQVSAIVHVIRCFDSTDIIHVSGKVDPLSDKEVIDIELCLSDLETVQKRYGQLDKLVKAQDKKVAERAKISKPILEQLIKYLEDGKSARELVKDLDETEIDSISDLHLITQKPVLYCCNVNEEALEGGNQYTELVAQMAAKEGAEVVIICGKLESEISALGTEAERKEFLESAGIDESGLAKMIRKAYHLLGLRTYFTAGEKELRAWTFSSGMKAPQCAGVIHTDFEKGFIRAEVYHVDDLLTLGSEQKVKEAGKLRVEGKEYVAKDGDIMHFRFNV
jgi:ribosome-binding ATPase